MAFESSSSKRLMREAKIGLTVVGLLLIVFLYVATKRLTGGFQESPTRTITGFKIAEEQPAANSENQTNPTRPKNQLADFNSNGVGQKKAAGDDSKMPEIFSPQQDQTPKVDDADAMNSNEHNPDLGAPPVVIESGLNLLGPKKLDRDPNPYRQIDPPLESETPRKRNPVDSGAITKVAPQLEHRTQNDLRSRFENLKTPSNDSRRDPVQLMSGDDSEKPKVEKASDSRGLSGGPDGSWIPPNPNLDSKLLVGDNDKTENNPNTDRQFSLPKPEGKTDSELPDPAKQFPELPKLELKPGLAKSKERRPPFKLTATELDSYWSIAASAYGNGQYFRALHQHNLNQNGLNAVSKGVVVDVPTLDALGKAYPKLMPEGHAPSPETKIAPSDSEQKKPEIGSTDDGAYRVGGGETLFSIAAEQLGQAARYDEILKLNRNELPVDVNHLTRLPAGLKLKLPQK